MNYYNNDKVTYQQLIMEQIKRIQDICSKELKNNDKILKNAMGEQLIEAEDTRYSFLQSVELLGSMLTPWFGNIMEDKKNKESNFFEQFCDYYDTELIEVLENKDFQEKVKEMFNVEDIEKVKTNEALQVQLNTFLLNDKIKEGRKIFRLLIKVFKSNDFLGSQSYGEGSGEGVDSGNDAFVDEEEEGQEIEE